MAATAGCVNAAVLSIFRNSHMGTCQLIRRQQGGGVNVRDCRLAHRQLNPNL